MKGPWGNKKVYTQQVEKNKTKQVGKQATTNQYNLFFASDRPRWRGNRWKCGIFFSPDLNLIWSVDLVHCGMCGVRARVNFPNYEIFRSVD